MAHSTFGHFNALTENLLTFTVCKDKGFKICWKIFELGPPYSTGAIMPLVQSIPNFKIQVQINDTRHTICNSCKMGGYR